jgi:transcriptional antiterminator NusG
MKKMYAVRAQSGEEATILHELTKIKGVRPVLPRNIVEIRKGGVWRKYEKVLIPGYIFVDCELSADIYYKVKNTPYVHGWVGGGSPTPMNEEDKGFIDFMANSGEPIPVLKFDSPYLKKSVIRSVDKRQRRIKATIMIMGKAHTVTFGYST